MTGSRPSEHTKHKCGDRARAKQSERGGAWLSFLSQGHNSLPCKHCRPVRRPLCEGTAGAGKRDPAAHIKASEVWRRCPAGTAAERWRPDTTGQWCCDNVKSPKQQGDGCGARPLKQKAICQTPLGRRGLPGATQHPDTRSICAETMKANNSVRARDLH